MRTHRSLSLSLTLSALVLFVSFPALAQSQARETHGVPAVPPLLEVEDGYSPFLVAHAVGTQNYACVPTATGIAWKQFAPQATLFRQVRDELRQQLTTHFLSANPDEYGVARPTWQDSSDSSRVWGKLNQSSLDVAFVQPGAIAWLLLDVVGAEAGPTGGGYLAKAKFIQRVNTVGGIAPSTGCDASTIGAIALVPYEADYVFYRADRK